MEKLYISMYHYTRDLKHSRYPEIKGLDLPLFKQQLEFFKNNFNVVRMEEVMDAAEGKYELPENALLLTFDDGYVDNYTYAFPLLEEYGMQGSFFIPGKTFSTHQLLDVNKIHYVLASADINLLLPDVLERMNHYRGLEFDYRQNDDLFNEFAEASRLDPKEVIFVKRMLQTELPETVRNMICSDLFEKYVGISEEKLAYELYMSEEQIRTMKRHGMFIGAHGYDHYWLSELPKEQMQKDILQGLDTIDEFIDRKRWVMNYPYGEYNRDVIDFAQSQGAVLGLTTEVRVANINKDSRFELPRLDCNDFPPKSNNYLNF